MRLKFPEIVLGIFLFVWAIGGASETDVPCDSIRTFADGKLPTREIFVSPTGNDSSGNGATEKPFKTIARAVKEARPGIAIRLLPGIHPAGNSIRDLTGREDAPIWIGGVPGHARPVIRGGTTAIQLSKVRYVILENLEVAGSAANGINYDDGGDYANSNATRRVLLRNIYIHDIGTDGIENGLKLSGVNDYEIVDCEFARTSSGGSGIDQVGCHRGLITHCTFTNAGSRAIQCKGGCEDIEIRGNRFNNCGDRAVNIGGTTGFPFFRPPLSNHAPNFEAQNIRVLANLFRGGEAPVAFAGAVHCLVANNTIIEPRRWILRILQETKSQGGFTFFPCSSNQFINNLVYFDSSRVQPVVNVGDGSAPGSFTFAHNLWYAFNRPGQSQPTLPAAETGGVYGLNPLFIDLAAGDFSLMTNSPAVAQGLPLSQVKADCNARCYANPPSVGAFEIRPMRP